MTYASEHIPHTRAAKNAAYNIGNLSKWWGDKKLSDVTARNCRAYAAARPPVGARRDLEVLRAAIGHWHREYGPLPSVPFVVMPAKPEPRDRWLTRSEAARLIKAARRTPHLARFILLGLYTGSRSGTIFKLQWNQIDFTTGVMSRRAPREIEDKRKRTPKVRLGRRVLAHLRRWRRLDPPETQYICHYDGRRVQKLTHSFPNAVRRAGLIDVTAHTLRHTRATWAMQAGVDRWEAAGALGMTMDTLERIYGHHHPDFQKRAAEV
jgi:integrase